MMSSKTPLFVKTYKEISAIPDVISAAILPGQHETAVCIHSNWSSQDLVKLEKTSFSRDYTFDCKTSSVISAGLPYEINSINRQSFSKSGKRQAIIREKKSAKSPTESYDLEIWNEFQKEKTFELTEHEDHGKVNTNAFGCLAWSSNENFILYTAEAKQKKSSSYFKVNNHEKDESAKQVKGEEYIYRAEWGENFVGSHHSVLVILDIKAEKTEVISIDKLFDEVSIGEAIWGPNDDTVVFVGYKEFPRRLGVRSCPIRRSGIYVYNLQTKTLDCISGDELEIAVRSPRFSPDYKTLIYLENKMGGPHFKCSKLQKFDWQTKIISTVVEIVDSPADEEFPGLYVISVPQRCWFKNNLFLTSQWRSFLTILCINIDHGTVQRVLPKIPSHPDGSEETFGACTVLDVQKNFILAEVSALNIEPCLVIGVLDKESTTIIKWICLDSNAPRKHKDIEWKIVKMNEDKTELYYEVILVMPVERESKSKVTIRPHGGPHSAYAASFLKQVVTFTKLKYITCLVNYRGSSGFGENSINSLPGNAGTNDVADVQEVAKWMKARNDVDGICVIGGSHGGFLGAHLIGQYPDFYKAAVLLNPVIDIAGMAETTDIPDWNFVEGGCGEMYDPKDVLDVNHLKSMWEKSPIQYAKNVTVPVLLLLGNKDLRVPYSQGLKFYHLLKARKCPVSAYVYEDCHSLNKTPHDADFFMQTALFLEKYA